MANRRSTRVTNVDPWIIGGEGQLRDLFHINPFVLITFRAIASLFRHYLITTLFLLSLYAYFHWDWSFLGAFIILPLSLILLRTIIVTTFLWYRNPTIPLIARKPTHH